MFARAASGVRQWIPVREAVARKSRSFGIIVVVRMTLAATIATLLLDPAVAAS